MKKILLCGMKYDNNFGDPIINECCKYIIENEILDKNIDYKIDEIDMMGKNGYNSYFYIKKSIKFYLFRIVGKIINKVKKLFKSNKYSKIYNYLDLINWYFSKEYMLDNKYYKNMIKKSDVIIFVGGGMIKYKYQNCYHYIDFVTKLANKYNIPVCLNAVGVEGYDEKNIKCKKLKKALNRDCVKMITTRDDIDKLKLYIEDNKNIVLEKVSDCAVYADVAYNKIKNENTKCIGLGVCRGNLFLDNDILYSEDDLLILWRNIIEKLEEDNIEWKIYTNGLDADNIFARKLINEYNYDKNKLIIPSNPEELVNTISDFHGIIATRLHSCIVAYSLKVPAIGLVWNKKLKKFGESIKYTERFFESDNFDENKIIEELKNAIEEGYSNIMPEEYRKTVKETLQQFLHTYCK